MEKQVKVDWTTQSVKKVKSTTRNRALTAVAMSPINRNQEVLRSQDLALTVLQAESHPSQSLVAVGGGIHRKLLRESNAESTRMSESTTETEADLANTKEIDRSKSRDVMSGNHYTSS